MRTTERHVAAALACGLFPVAWLLDATIGQALSTRPHGWPYALDFHPVWHAAHAFLVGASPYPAPSAVLEQTDQYTGFFVYPMPVAALLSPLGALPYPVAAGIFTAASVLAVLATLRLLGVRDWRCYGIAFATPAVMTAVSYGTLTPFLALALGLAWTRRDSPWRSGMAIALAVALKLFLWPLLLWLLLARRRRAAVIAAAGVAVLVAASWARIGFHDARSFAALMRNLATVQAPRGDGISALVGPGPALWIVTAAALGTAGWLLRAVRDERITFTTITLLAVWLSPIVWTHYYALVFPLLALWAPRFGVAWVVPLGFWLVLSQHPHEPWRVALALALSGTAVFAAALERDRGTRVLLQWRLRGIRA